MNVALQMYEFVCHVCMLDLFVTARSSSESEEDSSVRESHAAISDERSSDVESARRSVVPSCLFSLQRSED